MLNPVSGVVKTTSLNNLRRASSATPEQCSTRVISRHGQTCSTDSVGRPSLPRLDDEASVGRDERRPTCAKRGCPEQPDQRPDDPNSLSRLLLCQRRERRHRERRARERRLALIARRSEEEPPVTSCSARSSGRHWWRPVVLVHAGRLRRVAARSSSARPMPLVPRVSLHLRENRPRGTGLCFAKGCIGVVWIEPAPHTRPPFPSLELHDQRRGQSSPSPSSADPAGHSRRRRAARREQYDPFIGTVAAA